jgi:predicted transposase/invertase (TIGR01784 family)
VAMGKGLLDPKVDFVFKNIFGSEKNPQILISFLNATLKPINLITKVEIKGNDIEMHFIEIPKLEDNSDEKDMLVAWTEFLKDPESEKVRNLEMNVKEIREAKDELVKMSNDSTQREIYEMRAKILKDKVSALNKAKEEGREEGEKNKAIDIAKNAIAMKLPIEQIEALTGLSKDIINELLK